MKIITLNGRKLVQYYNLRQIEEINKERVIIFEVQDAEDVQLEDLVEVDGHSYRVKEIGGSIGGFKEVRSVYDVTDFDSLTVSEDIYGYPSTFFLKIVEFTGWRAKGIDTKKKRKIKCADFNKYDAIDLAREVYNIEVVFDNKNKVITYGDKIGKRNHVPLSRDFNVRDITGKQDSYEYFNMILPRGKDGLNIGSVNNGAYFLRTDPINPTSKDKMVVWEDNRYTDPQSLKEDAQDILDEHSKPLRSYEVDFQDLSQVDSVFKTYALELGDYVEVWDIQDSMRVVKIEKDLNFPINNILTLANKAVSLSGQQSNTQREFRRGKEAEDEIYNTINKGQSEIKDVVDENYKQVLKDLEAIDAQIDEELKEFNAQLEKDMADFRAELESQMTVVDEKFEDWLQHYEEDLKQSLADFDSQMEKDLEELQLEIEQKTQADAEKMKEELLADQAIINQKIKDFESEYEKEIQNIYDEIESGTGGGPGSGINDEVQAALDELDAKAKKYAEDMEKAIGLEIESMESELSDMPSDVLEWLNSQDGVLLGTVVKAGTITANQIGANAVTSNKIKAGSIATGHLQAGAVTANEIGANAITSDKILANSIKAGHLQAGAVTAGKLAADSVLSKHIKAGAVDAVHLNAEAVTAEKIAANSITSDHIQANSIKASHIGAYAIKAKHIDTDAITASKIQAGAIGAYHIRANNIESEHIRAGAIESEHIYTGAVTTDKIAAYSITSEKIQAASITASKIISGEIETRHLKTGSVTADKLVVDTALANKIAANTVISKLIMAGDIIGKQSKWNLDTGRLTNYSSDWEATHFAGKMEIVDKSVSSSSSKSVRNRISSRGYEFLPNDTAGGGGLTLQEWTLRFDPWTYSRDAVALHHDTDTALFLGYRNKTTKRNSPYVLFDKHNNFGKRDTAIRFLEDVRFANAVHFHDYFYAMEIITAKGQEWYGAQFNVFENEPLKKYSIGVPGGIRIIFDNANAILRVGHPNYGYFNIYDKGSR